MLRDYAEAIELLEEVVGELAGLCPDGLDVDLVERAKTFLTSAEPIAGPKH